MLMESSKEVRLQRLSGSGFFGAKGEQETKGRGRGCASIWGKGVVIVGCGRDLAPSRVIKGWGKGGRGHIVRIGGESWRVSKGTDHTDLMGSTKNECTGEGGMRILSLPLLRKGWSEFSRKGKNGG